MGIKAGDLVRITKHRLFTSRQYPIGSIHKIFKVVRAGVDSNANLYFEPNQYWIAIEDCVELINSNDLTKLERLIYGILEET